MVIEEALYEHLKNNAGVFALVGNRIYPIEAPQEAALPYLVYQRISGLRVRSHSGPSGLAHPRFQITGAAVTYPALRSVMNAVRVALDGFRGTMGGGVGVGAALVENEMDSEESFVSRLDVVIWHGE